ncbi:MAG: hypothetical protein NVSMB1_16070 [Polyangiales bacterium]
MKRHCVGCSLAGALIAITTAHSAPMTAVNGAKGDWAKLTSSPRPGVVNDPADAPLGKLCGGGVDAALVAVAGELAEVLAAEGVLPDAQEIEWHQRKAGSPHVWARTWGARVVGRRLDRKDLATKLSVWLGPLSHHARCGIGTVRVGAGSSSKEALAVIAIDPVADLAPIPTKASLGTWIDVDTVLLRGGINGRVVLLPPIGAPKTILSTTFGTPPHVKARFMLGGIGRHVVQVLADDLAGPRPVVEAEIYGGIDPPRTPPSSAVPFEAEGDLIDDPREALFRRLNGARAAEKLSPLLRDTQLEKVSSAHVVTMMRAHLLGHDVGDGDPATRVAAMSTVKWKVLGENVAKAKTERAAHRALYASPSHRSNMLDARFTKVGLAAVIDPQTGDVWVAQTYGGDSSYRRRPRSQAWALIRPKLAFTSMLRSP